MNHDSLDSLIDNDNQTLNELLESISRDEKEFNTWVADMLKTENEILHALLDNISDNYSTLRIP